jgi:hypothetical protein
MVTSASLPLREPVAPPSMPYGTGRARSLWHGMVCDFRARGGKRTSEFASPSPSSFACCQHSALQLYSKVHVPWNSSCGAAGYRSSGIVHLHTHTYAYIHSPSKFLFLYFCLLQSKVQRCSFYYGLAHTWWVS